MKGPRYSEQVDADGHRWHSKEYVQEFLEKRAGNEQRTQRVAHEHAWFTESLRAGAKPASSPGFRILDLGAGWGELAEHLLLEFPESEVVACDFSQPMRDLREARLAGFGERIQHVRADLGEASWRHEIAGTFDAIVSTRALHHLERSRLAALYWECAGLLPSGGLFLNLDRVLPHLRMGLVDAGAVFPPLRRLLERRWPEWLCGASRRRHEQWLRRAGFEARIASLGGAWAHHGVKQR